MYQDPQQNSDPNAPLEPSGSDNGAGSGHDTLHLETLKNRLAYWDEWTELDRERMGRDPWVAERLGHLQVVESWLFDRLLEAQGCPSSEELFDLAGPTAATELAEDRRAELREHLEICSSCAGEVATLSIAPPAPLLDLPQFPIAQVPRSEHLEEAQEEPSTGRILYRLRTFLITVAAVLLVWLFSARQWDPAQTLAADSFPKWPVLRADLPAPSMHPTGKVLAQGVNNRWFGMVSLPSVPKAGRYGVRVFAHGVSAFDSGQLMATFENDYPDMAASTGLPPGQYTLEPFALVQGVEMPLAGTELEVHAEPEVLKALEGLSGIDRVHFLHNAGWMEDARREASHLPQSQARDDYLAGQPR